MIANSEDSGFGWSAIRPEQPFDFAGREGHLHYTTNYISHGLSKIAEEKTSEAFYRPKARRS